MSYRCCRAASTADSRSARSSPRATARSTSALPLLSETFRSWQLASSRLGMVETGEG